MKKPHFLILPLVFVKLAMLGVKSWFWWELGLKGEAIAWLPLLTHAIAPMLSFILLGSVSKGWGVVRVRLSRKEWERLLILAALIGGCIAAEQGDYFHPSHIAIMAVALKYLFHNLSWVTGSLKGQCALIRDHTSVVVEESIVWKRLQFMKAFQSMLVTYTFVFALASVIRIFFLDGEVWIVRVGMEGFDALLLCGVAWVCRGREREERGEVEEAESLLQGEREEWKGGDKEEEECPSLLVLHHPPIMTEDGELEPNVAFGMKV